ncbi:hypothetical protein Q3G72_002600 [Acer saccharum]|nr:hypothetical protein Q3G72_002600 [Acer saccharum]
MNMQKMVDGRRSLWLYLIVYGLILLKTEGFNIGITYVETAVAKGAVCLDGSPPAYHLDKGFGAGINNWLVHIEGGGWCNNVADCLTRSNTRLGSSKQMDKEVAFSGMLSNEQKFNPDFYNWNRIKVRYCDGASFTGDVEAVDPATNLHFRGARVFLAIIEDLLAKGMKNAQNAILSGCSAGGLASILHCDKFRTLIPIGAKVKCLSDAGYFIHIKDVSGGQHIQTFYNEVVALHGSSKNLPESCTSRLNPALCFFPQYMTQQIQTPLFIINAAYDSWQIKNILVPGVADPHGTWHSCKLDINNCSSSQLQIMQSFRLQFLNAVSELGSSTSRGLFIDSCYSHCQTGLQETWLSADSPVLGNTNSTRAFPALALATAPPPPPPPPPPRSHNGRVRTTRASKLTFLLVLGFQLLLEIGVCIVMDWSFVHKAWEKWASLSVGSSGEPLKAALLINYDPTGPSRLLSTIAEQGGIKADPIEMTRFVDFIQQNKLETGSFITGSNELPITPLKYTSLLSSLVFGFGYVSSSAAFFCIYSRSTSAFDGYLSALSPLQKMVDGRRSLWLYLIVYGLISLKTEGLNMGITYVETAVAKGAVCLDGSPPAYHLDKGFGAGINNWLVHIEGGGWCNNVADCLTRSNTRLGSSKQMDKEVAFSGMLSNEQKFNPDFYNWNRIKVRYCDGASFTGDVEAVDPATNLHFRGARVFLAVIEDLLAKGMKNAQNAILSGCSAGGLASILHCDKFRTLIPMGAKVKCLSDAGYFIHIKDVSGGQHIQTFYNEVVALHGSSKNLPESCTSRLNPALCFFPQYMTQQIQTPLFIINAAYDSWQINNILVPGVTDPHGTWDSCKLDINNCSSSQLQIMQSFRLQFLNAVSELGCSTSRGLFVDSCYSHCQTGLQETWLSADSPMLGNTTIAKAVGDWAFPALALATAPPPPPPPPPPRSHNGRVRTTRASKLTFLLVLGFQLLLEIGVCIVMDWSFVHKAWEKWASLSVGSSGEPLKAALLINYDPTGPSRLLSTIAEQEGLKADPIEMTRFVDFIQQNKLQTGSFIIGSNEYMVTSIHENWFCARCMNTIQPSGEGAIVMQTKAFILVALYEGSIGPASRAMLSVDQLAWQLGRRNL